MEGATLEAITTELNHLTGDMIERRVAQVLGSALPSPSRLPLLQFQVARLRRHQSYC